MHRLTLGIALYSILTPSHVSGIAYQMSVSETETTHVVFWLRPVICQPAR